MCVCVCVCSRACVRLALAKHMCFLQFGPPPHPRHQTTACLTIIKETKSTTILLIPIFCDATLCYCSYTSQLYDMIYLLTATGLSSGGSTHLHINNT
jgi:hypothetical protein